jgi:hypothetical protein
LYQSVYYDSLEGGTIVATQKKAKFRGFTYVEPEDARTFRENKKEREIQMNNKTNNVETEALGYVNDGYTQHINKQ